MQHVELAVGADVVDAGVGAGVGQEDQALVEAHGQAVGHGSSSRCSGAGARDRTRPLPHTRTFCDLGCRATTVTEGAFPASTVAAVSDPLRQLFVDVAEDRFPPSDGGVTIVPPDATTGLHAALSFTAHAVVATDLSAGEVAVCGVNGIEGVHAADTLRALAGPDGWIGVLDVVLVARGKGTGGTALEPTDRFDDHPRVAYARDLRADVLVIADHRGLVTLGRGLGGRTELGFELLSDRHGRGDGRAPARRHAGGDTRRRGPVRVVRTGERPQPARPAGRRLHRDRRRGPPPPEPLVAPENPDRTPATSW